MTVEENSEVWGPNNWKDSDSEGAGESSLGKRLKAQFGTC